ncbi:MAG: hypothetical protein RTU63_08495 [Candidatus Thorarchaeota archaeon]
MSEERAVRELFVIHESGLPITHVGSGHVQIDDALFGGLLSAIENVGVSLGLKGDVALDTIRFRAYELVYTKSESGLVVLLTNQDKDNFLEKAKPELLAIGRELEQGGFMEDFSIRTAERTAQMDTIIARHARTIFAEVDDVFFWDEDHTFQLSVHDNKRWNGRTLFKNYLLPSPLSKTLELATEDIIKVCDLLEKKQTPSEILQGLKIDSHDAQKIENTVRLLHMYGLVQCFRSAV